jgi:hypothetical protein
LEILRDIGGALYTSATIAQPRIYNRALSAEEVWSLYQNPLQGADSLVKAISPAPLSIAIRDSAGNIGANGIKFPGTQSASTDANTLDDYEEGTWTPGVSFGGGTTGITYSAQNGSYTKIGNRVYFSGRLALSNKGSSTGAALITGLPFTLANSNANQSPCAIYFDAVSFANQMFALSTINNTTISLFEVTEAGVATALADTDFQNASVVRVAGHYYI